MEDHSGSLQPSSNSPSSPGMIVRIKLKNFMTYTDSEFFPNAQLNYIVGPSGVGKSTILCAVVLGLAGKPSIIGRSARPSDYIKHECSEAVIEIELYRDTARNVVIERKIMHNQSLWSYNGRRVQLSNIEEIVAGFNIKINTLCQILPQDRIQDFAGMNEKQLLDATQNSVGDVNLPVSFEELKTFKSSTVNNLRLLEDLKRKQENENKKLTEIKEDVQKYKLRQKILKQLSLMKKKAFWLEFDAKQKEYVEYSNQVKAAEEAHEKTVADYDLQLKCLREGKILEANVFKQIQDISLLVGNLNQQKQEILGKRAEYRGKAQAMIIEFANKLKLERSRESEMGVLMKQNEQLKRTIEHLSSEKEIIAELRQLDEKFDSVLHERNLLTKNEKMAFENSNATIPLARAVELRNSNSVYDNKLRLIEQDEHLHNAYHWLQGNKEQFEYAFYGPMFLELKITYQDKAKYIEDFIPNRDLMAFVFENQSDMTKFLKIVDKKGFKVNALHSEPPMDDITHLFQPHLPLSRIKKYGFTNYLLDFVEGPTAIIKYLCQHYQIHRIPQGSAEVMQHMDSLPDEIRFFYSNDKKVQLNKFRSSGQIIRSVGRVNDAKYLSYSANTYSINEIKNESGVLTERESQAELVTASARNRLKELEIHMDQVKNQRMELHKKSENKNGIEIKLISVLIRGLEEQLASLQEHQFDVKAEKVKLQDNMSTCLDKCTVLFHIERNTINEIYEKEKMSKTKQLFLYEIGKINIERETMTESIKRKIGEAKDELESKKKTYMEMKNNLQERAKNFTQDFKPSDSEFADHHRDIFDIFPDDPEILDEQIVKMETNLARVNAADKKILTDLRDQEMLIANLEGQIQALDSVVSNEEERLSELKDRWYMAFSGLLNKINENFTKSLDFVGCNGMVELDQGNDPTDYNNYGLSIKVKFRKEEELKKLDAAVQSGGEHSLILAVFLLSLQNVLNVPFRFVDEINQGMDEYSERRINFLMLFSVSRNTQSQFFLISPKLMDRMKMPPHITIHLMFGGSVSASHQILEDLDESQMDDRNSDDGQNSDDETQDLSKILRESHSTFFNALEKSLL